MRCILLLRCVHEVLLMASGKPWKILEYSSFNYGVFSVRQYPLGFGSG